MEEATNAIETSSIAPAAPASHSETHTYATIRELGRGAYGVVYLARRLKSAAPDGKKVEDPGVEKLFALKTVVSSSGSTALMRELRFFRSPAARSPYIVPLVDVMVDSTTRTTSLVMDLGACAGCFKGCPYSLFLSE